MATSYYFWGTLKSEFAKREGKDGLLMHAHISAMFSLFFLPLSFFLSLCSFYSLVSDYYLVMGCFSPLGIFPFESPLPRCLFLSLSASLSKCLP